MDALAKSAFLSMLGWIRSLSSEIWRTVSSPEGTTALGWIGRNWKLIAILLCAAGLTADLVVYLIRWQPYRVWSSFFRRIRRRDERMEKTENLSEDGPDEESAGQGEWEEPAYAGPSGENAYGRAWLREPEADAPQSERPEKRRLFEEQETEAEQPAVSWRRPEPEGTTEAFEQAIRPRRRRVTRLFSDPGEEETVPPEELIDRYAAYRRPVYPRNWKTREGDQEDQE